MARISLAICLLLLVTLSAVYEVQGTFLLRHYLRKIPRRSREATPFACNGMMMFMNVLERRCPLKPQYRGFFGKLRSYMTFIRTARGSKNFDVQLKSQAQGLQSALVALTGRGGSAPDTSNVLNTLMSMGKTLNQQQTTGGSTEMTLSQRRELITSMVQWARVIGQFVSSTTSKTSGSSIDMSSLGLDGVDPNAVPSPTGTTGSPDTSSPTTGSTTGTTNTATGSTNTGTMGSTTTGSGSYTAGGNSQTTNGGSTTTTCTTSACGGGMETGGNTIKGSINYQSGQHSSQQATHQSTQQSVGGSS